MKIKKIVLMSVASALILAVIVISSVYFIGLKTGVELEITNLNALGVTASFTNSSFKKVVIGTEYRIEQKTENGWKSLKNGDVTFPDSAELLGFGGSNSTVFGFDTAMPNGKYRIAKDYSFSSSGDIKTVYAEFDYNYTYNAAKKENSAASHISGEITSLVRKNRSGAVSEISDYYSIEKFVIAMQGAEWHNGASNENVTPSELFTVEIKGDNPVSYKFYKIYENYADVDVIIDGKATRYFINDDSAVLIKSFNEKIYKLHVGNKNATAVLPETDKLEAAKEKLFNGMDENNIKSFKKLIRELHLYLEYELLDGIEGDLKEPDGLQWNWLLNADTSHIAQKYESVWSYDENGNLYELKAKTLYDQISALDSSIKAIKNETAVSELSISLKLLNEAAETRDIEKLFSAHEIIHDYDFFIANSPVSYKDEYWIDDGAIKVFFNSSKLF